MRILLDTNLLTRSIEPKHRHYQIAINVVAQLIDRGEDLCLVPQVLYEFYVVSTRPSQANGLGLSASQVIMEIHRLIDTFNLLADSATIFPQWLQLIERHPVIGKPAHDTRIVAAMMAAQIPAILTFNHRDFQRYDRIQVLDPEKIVFG